jgi:serine/threonine protein kinase
MQIGAYKVSGELGRGGQGCVYRASGPDGRAVAVKVLLRVKSAGALARFERERRMLAALGESAGFVPLLDAGETPHGPFFVMPLLEGGTLRERLRQGPLGVDETLALGIRLSKSLASAHAQGIVHRDLKPENVLFSRGEAFISDFGLAKHFLPDAAGLSQSVGLSRTGEMRGTVGYMAPEQARDAGKAGPAADVFALGAILYECLAGRPAFEGETVLALLWKVENKSPSPVSEVRPQTPVWLARVVARALARDPEKRFPDAGKLLVALSSEGREGTRTRGARPLGVPIAAAGVLLGALGIAFGVHLSRSAAAPSSSPPRPSTPSPIPPVRRVDHVLDPLLSLLAQGAPVTSRDVPVGAVLGVSAEGRRELLERILDRQIVYSLDDASALRKGERSSPDVDAIFGLALLASGDVGRRAEAKSLLRRAQRTGAEVALAADLADECVDVEDFYGDVTGLSNTTSKRLKIKPASIPGLRAALPRLSAEAAAAVLQLLTDRVSTFAARQGAGLGYSAFPAEFGRLAELDTGVDLEVFSPRLALGLLVARSRQSALLGEDPRNQAGRIPGLERLAQRTARDDPDLALRGFETAMDGRVRARLLGSEGSESLDSDLKALEPIVSAKSSLIGSLLVLRYRRERCLYALVRSSSPDKELVAEGLAAARTAAETPHLVDPLFSSSAASAKGDLQDLDRFLVFAFETGVELDEADFGTSDSRVAKLLRAERARIKGRPGDALSIVDPHEGDDDRAIAAFAEADRERSRESGSPSCVASARTP